MKRAARSDIRRDEILPVAFRHPASASVPVEVLRVSSLRARAPASFFRRAHRSDFLCLLLADAALTHCFELQRADLAPGELLMIPAGVPHRFEPAGGDGWLLLVSGALLEPSAGHTFQPATIRLGACEASVRVLLGELDRVQREAPSPRSRRRAHHLVHALLLALPVLAPWTHRDEPAANVLRIFDAELEARFATTRLVTDYARTTGYSVTTLDRAARKLTGTSAKAHIDARVLLEARRLLVHSSLTVAQIAARVGFSEATNFAKFFRRTSGESAASFRRRHGAA